MIEKRKHPRAEKKKSEQVQAYLDSKIKPVAPTTGMANSFNTGMDQARSPVMSADANSPKGYAMGQVTGRINDPSASMAPGVGGGITGGAQAGNPPEYILTLPPQNEQQAGGGTQAQGPTYTLTLPTPEEQMQELERQKKLAHQAAFADAMDKMNAEFWRIAQNPGSMLGANESPYYSLYMKQYEQRARDRETNAYTRASEGTGGYGSSFATMAGDQAYRETMQEFDELAPTLIKSKSERMAEIIQEREMLKTMQSQIDAASSGLTESASAAAQDLQSTWGTAFSEKTQREYLASKGYSEADINAAMESQRKLASGAVTDYKAGNIADAVTQAQSLDEAYRQGTMTVEEYDEAKTQNSKVIMDSVYKGMERIEDTDYAALGISDEEWGAMEDGEKKLAVFDRVGQLVKSGAVTQTDYYKLLYNDLKEEFESEAFKKSNTQLRDATDSALVIQDLYDNGYMSKDMYVDLMYNQILPHISETRFWEVLNKQDVADGEGKEYKWSSNPFNSLENYNSATSYGSPAIAKISRSLSQDEKKLLLKLAREQRKNTIKSAASKGVKGVTKK